MKSANARTIFGLVGVRDEGVAGSKSCHSDHWFKGFGASRILRAKAQPGVSAVAIARDAR